MFFVLLELNSFQLPGVTVPVAQLFYLFASLAVCTIFHELGHALAAAWFTFTLRNCNFVSQGVVVNGVGAFLVVLYPGAYVGLSDEAVCSKPYRAIRIFAAGAWHNIILCALAALIYFTFPLLSFPLLSSPTAAVITIVPPVQTVTLCLFYQFSYRLYKAMCFLEMKLYKLGLVL